MLVVVVRDVDVVVCAPAERALARAVADEAECDVVSLEVEPAGLDLLKVLVDRAALLITNDTGPRHYAAALGTPVVTLFGATDPRWSDTGFERERVIETRASCHASCDGPRHRLAVALTDIGYKRRGEQVRVLRLRPGVRVEESPQIGDVRIGAGRQQQLHPAADTPSLFH